MFRAIECLCNIVILYLSFSDNRDKYYKSCGKCHKIMKSICIDSAKKDVQQNVYQQLGDGPRASINS